MGCQGKLVLTLAVEVGLNTEVMLLDCQLEDPVYDACSPGPIMSCLHIAHQVLGGSSLLCQPLTLALLALTLVVCELSAIGWYSHL